MGTSESSEWGAGIESIRVKLYVLKNGVSWESTATGLIFYKDTDEEGSDKELSLNKVIEWVVFGANFSNIRLSVISDRGKGEVLLTFLLSGNHDFEKEGDSIIAWFNTSTNQDVALSFKNKTSCDVFWNLIQASHEKKTPVEASSDQQTSLVETFFPESNIFAPRSEPSSPLDNPFLPVGAENRLPEPSVSSLGLIRTIVKLASYAERNDILFQLVQDGLSYLKELFALFHICENNEDFSSLQTIFSIVVLIIKSNSKDIWNVLLSDLFFIDFIACLEYPDNLSIDRIRRQNRNAIQDCNIIEVLSLNANIKKQMILNFRIAFIMNLALVGCIEDSTNYMLKAWIKENNIEIVTNLSENMKFVKSLMSEGMDCISSVTDSSQVRAKYFFGFLRQYFSMGNDLLPGVDWLQPLIDEGLLELLERGFNVYSPAHHSSAWSCCLEVLHHLVLRKTEQFQEFVCTKEPNRFLYKVCSIIVPSNPGQIDKAALLNFTECIGVMVANQEFGNQTDAFSKLLKSALEETLRKSIYSNHNCRWTFSSSLEICEMLLTSHTNVFEHFFCESKLIAHSVALFSSKNSTIESRLATVKFLKRCIELNNDALVSQIEESGVISVIMRYYLDIKGRYNVINSSILSLLESIVKSNRWELLLQFEKMFFETCKTFTFVPTFKRLHESFLLAQNSMTSPNVPEFKEENSKIDNFDESLENGDVLASDDNPKKSRNVAQRTRTKRHRSYVSLNTFENPAKHPNVFSEFS